MVQEQVTGVCKRLDSVGALHSEHVMDILTGLGICSNTKFRDMFKHLKQTAELHHLSLLLPNISSNASPIEQIEGILEKAVDQYDLLCTAGVWNKVSHRGMVNSIVDPVGICWNCSKKGHKTQECNKPKDPTPYNKTRRLSWRTEANHQVEISLAHLASPRKLHKNIIPSSGRQICAVW